MSDTTTVTCTCPSWQRSMPQIELAHDYAHNHGDDYTGDVFNFCPWCGKRIAQPVSNPSDVSDEAILREALTHECAETSRLSAWLRRIANWSRASLDGAATLHYDMCGWATAALTERVWPDGGRVVIPWSRTDIPDPCNPDDLLPGSR